MTRDERWNLIMAQYPAMKKSVVTMRQAGFRRFYDYVYQQAQNDLALEAIGSKGQTDAACSGGPSIEDLQRMMGMK